MVWPFSKSSSTSPEEAPPSSPAKPAQKYLDDLPPKFDDSPPPPPSSSAGTPTTGGAPGAPGERPNILKKVVTSIQPEDFTKLHQIPCFREAMLTGGAVGGVVFAVLITTRSAIPRAMNWGMAGFLIGASVSWEQCRWKLRQEKKEQRMAQEMYRNQQPRPKPPPAN